MRNFLILGVLRHRFFGVSPVFSHLFFLSSEGSFSTMFGDQCRVFFSWLYPGRGQRFFFWFHFIRQLPSLDQKTTAGTQISSGHLLRVLVGDFFFVF